MDLFKRILDATDLYDDNRVELSGGGRTGFKVGKEVIRTLDDGREYTVEPGRKRTIDVDDNKIINEWRKSLKGKNPIPFRNFLRNQFGDKTAVSIATRIRNNKNIEFNPTQEFEIGVKQGKKTKRLDAIQKLVDAHNEADTMLYRKQDIYDKLGVKKLTLQDNPNEVALLNQMDTPEDKVKKAFDKIITRDVKLYNPKVTGNIEEYNIIYKMISDIVTPKKGSKRFKADARFIQKTLNTHKPYLDIKENFDYFAKNAKPYIGQTFQEAFERAKDVKGGITYKNIEGLKPNYSKPEQNIFSFAVRHAYLNNRRGTPSEIQFYKFNKKGEPVGEPIDFNKLPKDAKNASRIFDGNKYGFTYKGQFFTKDTLRTKGYNSGLFKDVYKMQAIGSRLVPDPNDPGKKITLRQLLKDTGDKLTIGHNEKTGGVAGKNPFSNLRVESGKFNSAMYYAYNKIENPKLRKMIINNLQDDFGSLRGPAYEEAFINNKSDLAKAMFETPEAVLEQPSYYRGAGQKVIKDLGQDFFKQNPQFQKEAYRVSGLGSEENAKKFLAALSNNPACSVFSGKRLNRNVGGGTPDINECVQGGINVINSGKIPANKSKEFAQVLKGAGTAGRNLVKFGVIPEALFVGADSLVRLGLGDTFQEAGLRASDYLLPGDQTRTAEISKVERTLGSEAAQIVGRSIDYKNQLSKIDSLKQQKQFAETLSPTSEFDYLSDRTEDIKNINTRIKQAESDLQNKFMIPEAEKLYAERAQEEAYDISKAKSPFAKIKKFASGIEQQKDDPFLSDIKAPEKTQMELNLNMFPNFRDAIQSEDAQKQKIIMNLPDDVLSSFAGPDAVQYKKELQDSFKLENLKDQFGAEQIYGTQGTFGGQPLAGGGIAKMAGDRSGAMLTSMNPDSGGLSGLYKRAMKMKE